MNTYGRVPIARDPGEGAALWAGDGETHIDIASGTGGNCRRYRNRG